MSDRSPDAQLIAVPEQDGDLHEDQANLGASSSPTPAPSSSASSHQQNPPQIRRLRNFLTGRRTTSRATSSSSTNPNFNPEAIEFVPSPRMPSKRKASTTGRSGKSTLTTPRNDMSNDQAVDQPIISSEEVFSRGFLPRSMNIAFDGTFDLDGSSNIFESEAMGFVSEAAVRDAERMTDALSTMRGRLSKVLNKPELLQSNSAILFSYDGDEGSIEQSDDSLRLRYLPLCPATNTRRNGIFGKDAPLTILSRHREQIDGANRNPFPQRATWPPGELPMELFDLIAAHLPRDAVKSMRLVNKEFEEKVSSALFYTSVVPFNTELYDMIDEDTRAVNRASNPAKGKGRAGSSDNASADLSHGSLHWTNAKNDAEGKVYKGHGLRVFQGFGPHIKRFGMSFDVLESQLSRPPIKHELDHVDSYHGSYDWPPESYTRFANLAGLEKTADETLRMKSAFSHLTKVHDLALSVDSGLGWLNGPDKSIHGRVFQRQSPIFGHSRFVPDRQTQDANEFWAAIQSCNRGLGAHINFKEVSLLRRPLAKHPSELSGLQRTYYGNTSLWPSISANRTAPTISTHMPEDLQYGVMYTTFATPDSTAQSLYDKSALVPSELRKEQKEWLLETEWAQRAFLECYMLAVMDNPDKFAMVKTLAIAKISSGFLPLLARESFWDALPNLTDVTVLVKPDWRSVEKDNAGFAETCPQNPSEAVRIFHRCLLRDRLCLRQSVKKLNIGWASGGEHADGIFARNNHIMPAPITQLEQTTAAQANSGLVFSSVEHLTLTNCWMTPPMLEELVKSHAEKSLKKLTLHSVSLTSHPRFPAAAQGAVPQQVAQALAGLAGMQGGGAPNAAHAMQVTMQNLFFQQNQQPPAQPPWMLPNGAQNQQQQNQAFHNWMQQNQQVVVNQAGVGNAPALPNHLNTFPGMNVPAAAPPNLNNGHNIWLANANAFGGMNVPIHALPGPNNGNVFANFGPQAPQNFMPMPPAAAVPGPQAVNNVFGPSHAHWSSDHREGSWPEVLNKISPGPVYADYLPQPAPWEEQPAPRAATSLRAIELKSCGYAKLYHSTAFDQFAIEAGHEHHLSVWFRTRQAALAPAMLTTTDRYLGRIVQYMPLREQNALLYGWGLTMGWVDASKAEEAEYDGLLKGGTARFSGVVEKGMELVDQSQV